MVVVGEEGTRVVDDEVALRANSPGVANRLR